METTQDHEISPTIPTTEKKRTHQESEMGHEALQSSNGLLHHRRRSKAINRRLRRKRRNAKAKLQRNNSNASGEEDEEKVGIEKRIMLLQSIIPGGESLGIEKLFEETALYILALQGQVKAIKILTSLFESLEKEKSKLGG
ncbi:transcription factor PAR2-like [Macadamia integrifolia]|uniref:transcription factor PAR2-like n=1 Tax=Macadamia integrifolia TaxID=60698 RepID=UPI001C4FA6BE|nr:transcription factor PAR2-like [Macadamia integrifolia]